MAEGRIILPSAEVIIERLRSVMDEPHAVKGLYPRIAAHAGQRKAPEGVEVLIRLAICDYAAGFPQAVADVLEVAVPRFTAVLVEASAPAGAGDRKPPASWTTAGGGGPRGASVNHGASFSNGPGSPKWEAGVSRPVTFWDFVEGRLPE